MKDWFYAPGNEIVTAGITKNNVVKAIKDGNKTRRCLEDALGIVFESDEVEDVEYLLRIYSPLSRDNLSGCSGCDGCAGELKL